MVETPVSKQPRAPAQIDHMVAQARAFAVRSDPEEVKAKITDLREQLRTGKRNGIAFDHEERELRETVLAAIEEEVGLPQAIFALVESFPRNTNDRNF